MIIYANTRLFQIMEALEKPFICPECGASFTNEDRLSVHLRKHDMVLQLEAKGTFVG